MRAKSSAKPRNDAKVQSKENKETRKSWATSKKDFKDAPRAVLVLNQKWPFQSMGDSFLKRVRKITKLPTTTTQCKIFCRSGYHLEILPNGVVRGSVDQDSKYSEYTRCLARN